MIYIAKYHRKILALRREKGLKELCDENDLPLERPPPQLAEEGLVFGHTPEEEHVLSPEDEAKFLHHQQAFAKSHSFYRPHETGELASDTVAQSLRLMTTRRNSLRESTNPSFRFETDLYPGLPSRPDDCGSLLAGLPLHIPACSCQFNVEHQLPPLLQKDPHLCRPLFLHVRPGHVFAPRYQS